MAKSFKTILKDIYILDQDNPPDYLPSVKDMKGKFVIKCGGKRVLKDRTKITPRKDLKYENENDSYVKVLNVLDLCCAVYFLVEFLMIILVKKDIKHLFSWEGLIDFFSIIPSMIVYFLSKSNLRTILRMCKVFRVLRIYKSIHTLQYDNSNESGILNVNHIKLQFLSIVIIFFSLFFIASGLVFGLQEIWPSSFNDKDMTFAECVYFIIVTATTVGYGDIYPVSTIGKIITMISSFLGIAVVALPAGVITSGLMDELNQK